MGKHVVGGTGAHVVEESHVRSDVVGDGGAVDSSVQEKRVQREERRDAAGDG